MLEFGGVASFGVDIADLLELQRAFQRDGIEYAAADEEEVLEVGELFRRELRMW